MLNNINLGGRLTADPEMRVTPSGTAVTTFTLAVERDFSKEKKTDFINCVAWKHTAEFIRTYFKKGQLMFINGSLNIDNYTDREGHKRTIARVITNNVYFGGDKKTDDTAANTSGKEGYSETAGGGAVGVNAIPLDGFAYMDTTDEEDLPF